MNSTLIDAFGITMVAIVVIVSIGATVKKLYSGFQNRKLIKTVTKLHRGTYSEKQLVLQLLKLGFRPTAIFHDLYLTNRTENYCQIDLVLATDVGILVFEVKDYSGWIFGTGNQRNWTQILNYGDSKYYFYNPILQNRKHIIDLKSQLSQFENIPFYSIIVFYGNCQFRDVSNIPEDTYLIKSHEIKHVIKGILESKKTTTYKDKWEIANLLNRAVGNGDNNDIVKKHSTNINELKKKYNINN
jgi:hypothetical protein